MSETKRARIYVNRWFAKFAAKEKIGNDALCEAVRRAEGGLVDADLGSRLVKHRVAQEGSGKSGSYRALIFFRSGERAVFAYGFAKKDRANLACEELATFRKAAKIILALSDREIAAELAAERLKEICCGGEDL
ncbi:MAG: type II toxin-antitoxin system RelE/ParE family toxin [Pacificimonas sp.]